MRALLDAVYDWSRFNSLPRGYGWIRKRGQGKAGDAAGVGLRARLSYGDIGTIRRMGALLEREVWRLRLLSKLERGLPKTSA